MKTDIGDWLFGGIIACLIGLLVTMVFFTPRTPSKGELEMKIEALESRVEALERKH